MLIKVKYFLDTIKMNLKKTEILFLLYFHELYVSKSVINMSVEPKYSSLFPLISPIFPLILYKLQSLFL